MDLLSQNQLQSEFNKIDTNKDGLISVNDLKVLLNSCGSPATDSQIQDLVNNVEITNDGSLNLNSFIKIYNMHTSELDTKEDLEEAFRIFDKDGSGLLGEEKLMSIFKKIDENIKEEEILQLIKENDVDGDGKLNFEEFCNMVKNK